MKHRSAFSILPAIISILAFGLGTALTATAAPNISCDAPLFDFGEKDNSLTIKHTFVVKNTGTDVLNISRVKPACGCTVAKISSRVVAPGQSTEITATLDLKGRTGAQTKPMTVYSNDPRQPSYQLTLKGSAVTEVTVTPSALSFGRLEEGQTMTKDIKITAQKPINIKSVVAANQSVTHEMIVLKPGTEFLLRVTNKATLPPGRISETITITTDSEKSPTQRITVYGTVLDKLTISPNPLVIPESAGVKVDRTIYVRAGSVKNFQVLSATWNGSNTKVKIDDLGIRGFTVAFKGISATKELNGSFIELRTDVPGREIIRIPVTIRPQAAFNR